MKIIKKVAIFFFMTVVLGVTKGADTSVTLDTISDYNGWGWDALVVQNGIIELVIIPDIGGRIMQYGFTGDEYMAINDGQMGNNYNPDNNKTGPWSSWGYGGYKVWPAPQSRWNWPPPPHLDWGIYNYVTEHASDDSVVIYMKSDVETSMSVSTEGLQQARRIKVFKNSSRVIIEQILKNVSCTNNTWSIWEVTQALPSHVGLNDYSNISTYFPSDGTDIKKLMNNGVVTTAVNDSIRKYNQNTQNGKIGIFVKEGWCCYVDERDEQAYAKVFDVFPDLTYPDQNTNFQLYSGGGYFEIEVLSPIFTIVQGDSASFTEYWYASHTKGPIHNLNHAGALLSRLNFNSGSSLISGSYGIFSSGKLKLSFSDSLTNLGSIDTLSVTASDKYILNLNVELPEGTTRIDLIAYDLHENLIDTLDTWIKTEGPVESIERIASGFLEIYPTVTISGSVVNLQFSKSVFSDLQLVLTSANGHIVDNQIIYTESSDNKFEYRIPDISSGIYFVTVKSGNFVFNSRIIVK